MSQTSTVPIDFDYVEVRSPDDSVRRFRINSRRLVIGRSGEVEIRLDSERISRRHAEIIRDPFGRWWARDLGSRNGIRVNGRRVSDQLIAPRDVIQVGDFSLRLLSGHSDSQEALPLTQETGIELEGRTLDAAAPLPVTAAQLDKLLIFSERLAGEADQRQRRRMLCEELLAEWFGGLAVYILRPGSAEDEFRVLWRASKKDSVGRIHVSRTLLRATRAASAPMVGSNVASRDGLTTLSLDQSIMHAAAIACPLDGGGPDAVLYVAIPPELATPEWLALAALAARHWGLAETTWRERERAALHDAVDRDLKQARLIQQRFLPRACSVERFHWSVRFEPCRWVGGDYVDVFPLADGRVFVGVADVSGKGLQAALIAASLHTLVRTALASEPSIVALFGRANEYLRQFLPGNSFVTMAGLLVDPQRGRAEYANAGHPPPFCLSTDGKVARLASNLNLPLGVEIDGFTAQNIDLEPGQMAFLYSDGCTDLINTEGKRLSVDLLADMLHEAGSKLDQRSPQCLVDALFQKLETHRGLSLPPDDRALVVCATDV